jgi:Fic family protein
MSTTAAWPARTTETVPWCASTRRGSSADRRLTSVEVSVPPHIAALPFDPLSTRELDRAVREVRDLEAAASDVLEPLSVFLVRMESVASSKIEHVTASPDDFARALGGVRSNPSAMSMVSAGRAMTDLVNASARTITLDAILGAHRTLMADDPSESAYAGKVRDMQNWIGGSDYSPRGAVYVPPPADTVPAYLDDLLAFTARDDLHPVAQAALAHAQFESIHPFTDGNGRIGRALLSAVLRRRGVTDGILLPIASALSADTEHYFDLLTAYRDGDADAIVQDVALCMQAAARESAHTADLFRALPTRWRADAGYRRNSAPDAVIGVLLTHPVFTVDEMASVLGRSDTAVFRAVDALEEVGVVREVTDRRRDRVFAAGAVLDELGDLDLRIRTRITEERAAG